MIPFASLDAEGIEVPTGVVSDRAVSHPLGSQLPAHWLAQVERNPGSGPVVVNGGPRDYCPLEVEPYKLINSKEADLKGIFSFRVQQDRLFLLCKSVMGDHFVAGGRGGVKSSLEALNVGVVSVEVSRRPPIVPTLFLLIALAPSEVYAMLLLKTRTPDMLRQSAVAGLENQEVYW